VSTANLIGDALTAVGFKTVLVHGEMPTDARRAAFHDFQYGDVQCITNCMVATEGTDLPRADCVVIARPTLHQGLYIQMTGRVLRPSPGKDDALVLDVVGASQRHALHAKIDLFGEEAEEREPGRADEDEMAEADGDGVSMPAEWLVGPLHSVEVDLFHGSTSMWLRTYGNIWFLPAGERYIAIIPRATGNAYDVVAMHTYKRNTGRYVAVGIADLSYAMAYAESDVSAQEKTTAMRANAWRKRAPSERQRELANRLHIPWPNMTSGEISNAISVSMASSRIDPVISWLRSQGW
jgi:superfamily II DNA or RNA helicase